MAVEAAFFLTMGMIESSVSSSFWACAIHSAEVGSAKWSIFPPLPYYHRVTSRPSMQWRCLTSIGSLFITKTRTCRESCTANYFKFFERAREELLGPAELARVWQEHGIGFAVYKLDCTFRAPARHGDEIEVEPKSKWKTPGEVSSISPAGDQEDKPLVERIGPTGLH